jgi:ArsR family transcriptional regulator
MINRIQTLAEVLRAISDLKRMKIIKMLASNMQDTLCVSDVAIKLGISQPAASQHIKVLKSIGVLTENRKGFRVYYSINHSMLFEIKKEIDSFFLKAFETCPHDLNCEECDYNCGG